MTNLINVAHKVTYRQSLNLYSKTWGPIKRRSPKTGKWETIQQMPKYVSKKHGYTFALWRMKKDMENRKDEYGRIVWGCEHKKAVVGTYSYHYMIFTRRENSIIGGANISY